MPRLKTRRKHLRVSPERDNPITVSLIGADFIGELKATDISRGGIGIAAPSRFQGCNLHEPVQLAISLPYPKRILVKATGKIVHIDGAKFGIAFSNVPGKGQKFLQQYISRRILKENIFKRAAFFFGFI